MKIVKSSDIKEVKEVRFISICPECGDATYISSSEMSQKQASCSECYRYFKIKD